MRCGKWKPYLGEAKRHALGDVTTLDPVDIIYALLGGL